MNTSNKPTQVELGQNILSIIDPTHGSYGKLLHWVSTVRHLLRTSTPSTIMSFIRAANETIQEANRVHLRTVLAEHEQRHQKTLIGIQERMRTGDEDFDAFRDRCYCLDMYYDYSDDQAVWRKGKAAVETTEAIANEKGGMYLAFWEYFKSLH